MRARTHTLGSLFFTRALYCLTHMFSSLCSASSLRFFCLAPVCFPLFFSGDCFLRLLSDSGSQIASIESMSSAKIEYANWLQTPDSTDTHLAIYGEPANVQRAYDMIMQVHTCAHTLVHAYATAHTCTLNHTCILRFPEVMSNLIPCSQKPIAGGASDGAF